MKVFICWSGDRSELVAERLRDWLPNVFQDIEPWISKTGLNKGSQWQAELLKQLDKSTFGIVCLSPDNLDSRWLLFESGALAKSQQKVSVCTYLLDVDSSDIRPPLGQFNHTIANKDDTFRLMQTINRVRDGDTFEEERLRQIFEKWWPDLKEALEEARKLETYSEEASRDPEELLEEILEIVRRMERNQSHSIGGGVPGGLLFDDPPSSPPPATGSLGGVSPSTMQLLTQLASGGVGNFLQEEGQSTLTLAKKECQNCGESFTLLEGKWERDEEGKLIQVCPNCATGDGYTGSTPEEKP